MEIQQPKNDKLIKFLGRKQTGKVDFNPPKKPNITWLTDLKKTD